MTGLCWRSRPCLVYSLNQLIPSPECVCCSCVNLIDRGRSRRNTADVDLSPGRYICAYPCREYRFSRCSYPCWEYRFSICSYPCLEYKFSICAYPCLEYRFSICSYPCWEYRFPICSYPCWEYKFSICAYPCLEYRFSICAYPCWEYRFSVYTYQCAWIINFGSYRIKRSSYMICIVSSWFVSGLFASN